MEITVTIYIDRTFISLKKLLQKTFGILMYYLNKKLFNY